jgi:hypothetical protein
MAHNILGAGMDTEILTGRPLKIKTLEEHKAEENLKNQKALQEQLALTTELPHVLPGIAGLLEKRLMELMKRDPESQAYLQTIGLFAAKMEAARAIVTKVRRQSMGISLCSLTDEARIAPHRDTNEGSEE